MSQYPLLDHTAKVVGQVVVVKLCFKLAAVNWGENRHGLQPSSVTVLRPLFMIVVSGKWCSIPFKQQILGP